MTHKWFRFVPHHRVRDYLELGWNVATVDLGHHGEYSVLLQWLCACPLIEPRNPHNERYRAVLPFLPRPAPEADV